MTRRLVWACAGLAALGAAQPPASDSRNTRVPNTDTHFTMREYRTLSEWEARKKQLREQILFAAGLDPAPARSAIRAEIFGRIENKDYSIEKVLLETWPNYYLGGNLYRPLGRSGRFPGVISPHGHWNYGRLEHVPLGSIPARCINLARQGYVVFAYDMVGYNDTIQTPHAFGGQREQLWGFGPLGLQLWNSTRALDFLETLPEVDRERLGATGASGGGTQTFLVAAVDERVKFAAPVNMISGYMQGGSPCENAPGLRVGTFNVEFGAMMAPRPLLMVSATGDWTSHTLEEEFPAIRKIYELYGKGGEVEAVRIDAPHNYNQQSREAVYQFFAKKALRASDWASYRERNIRVEKLQDMLALHGRALPKGALDYAGLFRSWREAAERGVEAIAGVEELKRLLRRALAVEWPGEVRAEAKAGEVTLTRPGVGDRVAGRWSEGRGRVLVAVHEGGAEAGVRMAAVVKAKAEGRPVLVVEAFQTGKAVAPRDRSHQYFLTFNKSDDAERVQDVLTALKWASARGEVELAGEGRSAIWCRFAAAVSPVAVRLEAPAGGFTGSDEEMIAQFFVPGIQRAGGWKTALRLTGGR